MLEHFFWTILTVAAISKYDFPDIAKTDEEPTWMAKHYKFKSVQDQKRSGSQKSSSGLQEGLQEIFLVPHTHDDVGWLVTPGALYLQSVELILDTVADALGKNPARRFIWSEMKFFEMWWTRISNDTKGLITSLIANGQFEFVGGGWSQSDEVSCSYRDMIDNVVTGHEFLRRTFPGVCPGGRCVRFGYQIDMFSVLTSVSASV